jgi:hypothetical protein
MPPHFPTTRYPTFDYDQEADPGAVGYKKTWFQESTNLLFRRNAANDNWVSINSGGGVTPPVEPPDPEDPPPDTIIVDMSAVVGLDFTGVADSSTAFQALMDAHVPGMEYRWPVGTLKFHSIDVTNKQFMTFQGVSRDTSILLWGGTDNLAIMTFTDCSTIEWYDIGVDNKSIVRFGGVRHLSCANVTYDTCKFYDSASLPVTTQSDRYSIVFVRGANVHTNITITDCTFADLQFEYNHVRGVKITGCESRRSISTAGFGAWAHAPNYICEDVLIDNCTFYTPRRGSLGAITFFHDVAGLNFCSYQRITISNNTIIFISTDEVEYSDVTQGVGRIPPGITIGMQSTTAQSNIFKDITIENNTLSLLNGDFLRDPHGAISLYSTTAGGSLWDNIIIRNNTVNVINFTPTAHGITARRIRSGSITGNTVINVNQGYSLADSFAAVTITGNKVINGSVGYRLNGVIGGLTFDATNEYYNSTDPLSTSSVSGVNSIVEPTEIGNQVALPSAVTFLGDYTDEADGTTNIFNSINEATPVDDDYVQSPETPVDEVFVVKMASAVLSDPAVSFGHVINYRYRKDFDGGDTLNLTFEWRQGYTNEGSQGTLIASNTHLDVGGVEWVAGALSLTDAQADSVTVYTDLYVRVVWTTV